MIGDSELGWRGASLTAYCLLLLLPALILMRRGPTILGPAWALFVGLSPAILLYAFSARMYMVYMLFCTLAIVLNVFCRPMKWDRKVLLYLLASLAASFSNERFIVFAPAILLSSLMAQWSLLGREPLLDFLVSPQFVTPVSAIGCALIHFVDPFLPFSFLNETSTPVSLGLAQSWSYPIDVLALTPVPPLLADAHGDYRFFHSPPRFKKPTIRPYRRQSPGHRFARHSLAWDKRSLSPNGLSSTLTMTSTVALEKTLFGSRMTPGQDANSIDKRCFTCSKTIFFDL